MALRRPGVVPIEELVRRADAANLDGSRQGLATVIELLEQALERAWGYLRQNDTDDQFNRFRAGLACYERSVDAFRELERETA